MWVHIENNRGGCFDARCSVANVANENMQKMSKKKGKKNMIQRSVDYRQDLINQIRLCKFLVGDTPSRNMAVQHGGLRGR